MDAQLFSLTAPVVEYVSEAFLSMRRGRWGLSYDVRTYPGGDVLVVRLSNQEYSPDELREGRPYLDKVRRCLQYEWEVSLCCSDWEDPAPHIEVYGVNGREFVYDPNQIAEAILNEIHYVIENISFSIVV